MYGPKVCIDRMKELVGPLITYLILSSGCGINYNCGCGQVSVIWR